MKNTFLQVSIGISLILLASGFFIRSIVPAHAAPSPDNFLQQGVNKIGKYQMSLGFASYSDGSSGTRIIIWDTETGKSAYYRNIGSGWEYHEAQLPANPIK